MSTLAKKWTSKRKMEVVLQFINGGNAVDLSRENAISQSKLFKWKDSFIQCGTNGLKTAKSTEADKKVRQLERLVGRLTMENEILKKTEELQRKRRFSH